MVVFLVDRWVGWSVDMMVVRMVGSLGGLVSGLVLIADLINFRTNTNTAGYSGFQAYFGQKGISSSIRLEVEYTNFLLMIFL